LLEGKAEVIKNAGNAEYTGNGLKHLDEWLGNGNWDVIHFNWGLWDMYGWRYHQLDRSPAMYERRLEQLVARLEKTGAKLIWATTTPACPAPETTMRTRFEKSVQISPEVQQQYADAALRVMQKHKVAINDLHALMLPDLKKYQIADDNVHFNRAGSERLAAQVAKVILDHLGPLRAEDSARPSGKQ
jgi:acyl-CoA thioesterase-1